MGVSQVRLKNVTGMALFSLEKPAKEKNSRHGKHDHHLLSFVEFLFLADLRRYLTIAAA